jgi:aspartyl-tRNA(Asn)/glutamyl-tRNA(Gln) amidotransferase subunit C
MDLSLNEVAHIAHLARIELAQGETAQIQTLLNDFFDFVDQIHAENTDCIVPLAHPVAHIEALHLPLRDDLITDTSPDDEAHCAATKQNGCYLVPKVIE